MHILNYKDTSKLFISLELGVYLNLVCDDTLRERKPVANLNNFGEPEILIPCNHNSYLELNKKYLNKCSVIDGKNIKVVTNDIFPENPFRYYQEANKELSITAVLTPHYRKLKEYWYIEPVRVYLIEKTSLSTVIGIVGRTFEGYHSISLFIQGDTGVEKAYILDEEPLLNPYSSILTEVINES